MIGIILALLAAATYALSTVMVRKGLNKSDIIAATMILTLVSIGIFFPLTLIFTNIGTLKLEAIAYFALAGVLAPGLFTLLFFRGMKVTGVSISPAIFSVVPIFGAILGVLLLNEALSLENWTGIILVAVGVWSIGRNPNNPNGRGAKSFMKLVFPILTGLTLAVSIVIRKHALSINNEPIVGATIGLSISFLLYLPLFVSSYYRKGSWFLSKNIRLYWKAAILGAFAEIAAFSALSFERVSIVAPILQTELLFILLFARILLNEIEQVSYRLLASTSLVVVGAILVSIQ